MILLNAMTMMMMVVVEYAGGENDDYMFNKQTNKQTNNLDFKDNDDGGRGICRWCPDGSRWVEWRNLCRAPAGQREVE